MRTDDQGIGYVTLARPGGESVCETYTGAEAGNEILAASAGNGWVIDELLLSTAASGSFKLQSVLEGTPDVITMLVPPIFLAANSTTHIVFNGEVVGGVGERIEVVTTPSGNHSIQAIAHLKAL